MENLLDVAVAEALKAYRIVGQSKSYADDNRFESKVVFAYMNGGTRPISVATAMGRSLVALEDARRENYGPPVVDSQAEYADGAYTEGNYSQ